MQKFPLMTLFLIFLATFGSSAHAECYKDGVAYPTGTVIDGFICTEDGTWVKE